MATFHRFEQVCKDIKLTLRKFEDKMYTLNSENKLNKYIILQINQTWKNFNNYIYVENMVAHCTVLSTFLYI